jgi:hypothetical protein
MQFYQAIWLFLVAAVSIIGCNDIAKHLSQNYTRDGNKFMTVFTYVAVYGIYVGGSLVFLKADWFS